MNGFFQWEMLQFHHLSGIVEEDDAVTHQNTHQRHKTEDSSHGDGHTSEEDTRSRAENTQRQANHDQHGLADTLEVPEQYEEDDGNGDDQGTGNLRSGVFIIIILTAYLHLHAFGQLETL